MKHHLRHLASRISLALLIAILTGCSDTTSLIDTLPVQETSPLASPPVDYLDLAETLGITGPGEYSGYEALVLSIIHYQELQQRGELTDEQATILADNIREERAYRELQNAGKGFRRALVDGHILASHEGNAPTPADFSISDVSRRSGYPFVVYTATRLGLDDDATYHYNVRLLRLEDEDIPDAVMYEPYIYRNTVWGKDGTMLYYIEALLPRKQALGNRFIRAFERQIREQYGEFQIQAPANTHEPWLQVSKSSGNDPEDCIYYYDEAGTLVMDCDIVVEGERYHCSQDGTCDYGEEEHGGGDEWGEDEGSGENGNNGGSEDNCETCNNQDGEEPQGDYLMNLLIHLEETVFPPVSKEKGTRYQVTGSVVWDFAPPHNIESISYSGDYSFTSRRSYLQGQISHAPVGGGFNMYGAGFDMKYVVRVTGGTLLQEDPEILESGSFTKDNEVLNFRDGHDCIGSDTAIEWTLSARPSIQLLYTNGRTAKLNPVNSGSKSTGGECHYLDA